MRKLTWETLGHKIHRYPGHRREAYKMVMRVVALEGPFAVYPWSRQMTAEMGHTSFHY